MAVNPPAPDPAGTRPYLQTEVGPSTAEALGTLWLAVTRAGGAVGYVTHAAEGEIRAAARRVIEDVTAGREIMIVIGGDALLGTAFLIRGSGDVFQHRAAVRRVMVHPDVQRRGWGTRLIRAAQVHARELGCRLLTLSTRDGTGLPEYYAGLGWTEFGRLPGALHVGEGRYVDEVWFRLALG